jgi:frataxin-like iron-binding protein CyaY
VAQQTPAPAPVPAAPPPAQSAPTGNAATPDAPAPAVNQAPDQPASPVPPETTPTEPATEDVLPDLSPEAQESEDFSVGEIPTVETVELTPETARKAMDAYVMVREKYKDAALENYENLQDFVEQDSHGKAFDADIKGYGFATANDWNTAITTVGFAYSNLIDDQTADLRQQIEEVKNDSEMAQDMRDRMVQALNAMIPSDNNRKVVEDMSKDPVYAEKLKALETEEE